MAIPDLGYPDNEEAAQAVHWYTKTMPAVRHLRLQPASGGASAFGEWWLVPGPDGPPYRYSKLFLARDRGAWHRMVAGFCFHRGVGRHLDALADPGVMMGGNWFWSRFLSDALAGAFDTPLRETMVRSGQPARIMLELYHLNHAPGPTAHRLPDDRLTFTADETTLTLRPDELPEAELAPLTTAANLRELALWIEGMPDLWWFWIDVRIGIRLGYGDQETGTWDAADLWEKALAPWTPWLH